MPCERHSEVTVSEEAGLRERRAREDYRETLLSPLALTIWTTSERRLLAANACLRVHSSYKTQPGQVENSRGVVGWGGRESGDRKRKSGRTATTVRANKKLTERPDVRLERVRLRGAHFGSHIIRRSAMRRRKRGRERGRQCGDARKRVMGERRLRPGQRLQVRRRMSKPGAKRGRRGGLARLTP